MNQQLMRRTGAGAVALVLGLTTLCLATPKKDPQDGKMIAELGLSKEQQEKLQELRKQHKQEASEAAKLVREKREALRAEIENPSYDENRAKALNEELKNAQNKMADQRLKGIGDVRAILTQEQYGKFIESRKNYWEERREKRYERKGSNREGRLDER